MEMVDVCTKGECHPAPPCRPATSPCTTQVEQCSKRYIQPPRIPSYAPKKIYRPQSAPFDAHTTYHVSYLNTAPDYVRAKTIRPTPILQTAKSKFQDDTTNRLSYRPVWDIVKAEPIVPIRRKLMMHGPMQTTTTVHEDFGPKHVERPGIIIPSGNIRFCTGPMEGCTTSGISFVNPGLGSRPVSFKPSTNYSRSDEPTAKETTHTLSYQPFRVKKREVYPWAQKSIYKPPVSEMNTQTTYSKSYLKTGIPIKVKPILPISGGEWLRGNTEFHGKTCYRDAFIPRVTENKCIPIVPHGNINLSNKKMASDTTNKLSYQSVCTERRTPFLPRQRNMMGSGLMQSITTSQSDYQYKIAQRPKIVIPSDNIQHSNKPLESSTTAALSYMNHGFIQPPSNFKPSADYIRSSSCKLDADTINKLSYQPWTPAPREILPWIKKIGYQRPKERMAGDSMYNTSFTPPGYYIEECGTLNGPDGLNCCNSTTANVCSNNDC